MPQNISEHNEPNSSTQSPGYQKPNSSAKRDISKDRSRPSRLHSQSEEDSSDDDGDLSPPPTGLSSRHQPYRPQPGTLPQGDGPFSPPSHPSRPNTYFGQELVPTKPDPNIYRSSSEKPPKGSVSIEYNPPIRQNVFTIRYPTVPDMSKPRFSEPIEPASPHYRGSRHQQDSQQYSHVRYVPSRYRSRTPSPTPFRESQSSNRPDNNRLRLEAELAVYKNLESKVKAAEDQENRENQIRKEAYQAQNRRMEDMKRAREDVKKEFELARLTAEQTAREKIENERKVEAAIRQRDEEQAGRMEREIRIKLEAEREAEEAERIAKQKREDDLERLIQTKVMEKLDDFIEIAKQRLEAVEGSVLGMARELQINHEETSDEQSIKHRVRQPHKVSRTHASSDHLNIASLSSRRPFTAKDAAPPGDMELDEDPIPVPEPPSFILDVEDQYNTKRGQSTRKFEPRFYGDLRAQSRGRPQVRSDTSSGNIWQRSPLSDNSSHPDIPQEFVDRIANAVIGMLKESSHQRSSIPPYMYNEHPFTFSQPHQEDWIDSEAFRSQAPIQTSDAERPQAALREASQTAPGLCINRSDFEGRERLSFLRSASQIGVPSFKRATASEPIMANSRKGKHGMEGEMRDRENAVLLKPHNLRISSLNVEGLDSRMGSSTTSQHLATSRGNVVSDESLTWVNSDVSASGRKFQSLIRPLSSHARQPWKEDGKGRLNVMEKEHLTLALQRILSKESCNKETASGDRKSPVS